MKIIHVNLFFLLFCGVYSQDPTNDTKILVDQNLNPINPRPSRIKPTSATVEHKPGVPPGWSTKPPPVKPGFKPFLNHKLRPDESLLVLQESQNTANSGNSANEQGRPPLGSPEPVIAGDGGGGFVNWVLGAFGINKPSNPPTSDEGDGPKDCQPCSCGQTYKHTRIVGGVETQVNEYPWMVYLTYNGRFYCGASVINNKYLLTAAHCVSSFPKEKLEAVFLDHDRSTQKETKTFKRKIVDINKHRSYNQGASYNNDIALLKLGEPLSFNGPLMPVCLPPIGPHFSGETGIVTGWGATAEHGSVSNTLREVKVPIMSNTQCKTTKYGNKITENMVCAGYAQGKMDSCQGDSGGPMHVLKDNSHVVAGVVSWGEGCAQPEYPGVYTRVNRYISWIKSSTKDACYC